jgi:hypothetical protein
MKRLEDEDYDWEAEVGSLRPVSPLEISEAYADRATEAMLEGAWLDSLIYASISEHHLIGDYSPAHKPLDPEEVPMRRTLPYLANHARIARDLIRRFGHGTELQPGHFGMSLEEKLSSHEISEHDTGWRQDSGG